METSQEVHFAVLLQNLIIPTTKAHSMKVYTQFSELLAETQIHSNIPVSQTCITT